MFVIFCAFPDLIVCLLICGGVSLFPLSGSYCSWGSIYLSHRITMLLTRPHLGVCSFNKCAECSLQNSLCAKCFILSVC